jgi:hypothetical protein
MNGGKMKPTDDANFRAFTGLLNAVWLSAMLWAAAYLIYRYASAVDGLVDVIARRAGL